MVDETAVPARVREIAAQLGEAKRMRRGSVTERRVKCSKEGCPCADNADARHGPYVSLTRAVDGKTMSRLLSKEQAKVVREQIDAGRVFRKKVDDYWEACEEWADAALESPDAASQEAEKKGGSKKPSRQRSSRRSTRS